MCIQPNSNGPSLINWAIERRYDHWQAETEKTEIKLSWTVRNYFSLIITVVSFFCQCVASAVVIIVLVIFISRLGYGGQGNCLSGFFLWPKISFQTALERPRAESIPPHTDTHDRDPKQNPQKDSWQHFLTLRASRMIITAGRNGELQLLGSCLVTPLLTTGQLPDIVHRDIYLIYHMLLWLGDSSENDQLRN